MTDEELVLKAQQGDQTAMNEILTKYKSLVTKISRHYFLIGGDVEDLIQEGMIGLYQAIQGFKRGKNATFKTFAVTCIKHKVYNTIKKASSEKNTILSHALSISEQEDFDDEGNSMEIVLSSDAPKSDELVIEKENAIELIDKIKENLSPLEQEVLVLYLKGYSYKEISQLSNTPKKSVDNALTRIKSKLQFLKKEN